MPPDVDAYAAAVAGRALATKCTGGFTTQPRRPTGGPYYLGYVANPVPVSATPFNARTFDGSDWDGQGFGFRRPFSDHILPIKWLFGVTLSANRPFGQWPVRGFIIPVMSVTGPFGPGRAIPDDFLETGKTIIFEGYYQDPETEAWSDPFWTMTLTIGRAPVAFGSPTVGWRQETGGVSYVLERPQTTADDRMVTGMSVRDAADSAPAPDTFEFYARLEGGVGSILEADEEGNQTELQTVNMTVRYDARFRVGDWVRIADDFSFVYEIQSIDEVGRRKWQTLTMIQRVAV